MRFTALAAVSALALVVVACSSESPTGTSKGGSTPSSTSKTGDQEQKTNSGTAPTGSTTDPTDPAPSGGSCGSQAKLDACFDCCAEANPAADEKLATDWAECACAADKCGTQCAASVCAATPKDPQQGDACDTCLQAQSQACGQVAEQKCAADANCKKLFDCEDAAKCADKPE